MTLTIGQNKLSCSVEKRDRKKISSSVGAFKGKRPLQSSSRMNRKGKIQNIRVIQLLMPFFILFSGSRKCWWPKVGKSGKGAQQQAVAVASSEATRKKKKWFHLFKSEWKSNHNLWDLLTAELFIFL